MPLIINIPQDLKSIELSQFISCLEHSDFDLNNDKDIYDLAILLNRLKNNKRLLFNHTANELKNLADFQKSNIYDYKNLVLHRSENFLIRAVFWLPQPQFAEDEIFNIYHDHNFDLLTIGYWGPGYQTEAFTYEINTITGLPGEQVNVKSEGKFTLVEGKILLYKAKKDIHNQIPPSKMSVSLNVIPLKGVSNRQQFEFDKKDFKIRRYIHVSSNEFMVRLSGILGDSNNIEPLTTILKNHDNPVLRGYAALALTQISADLNDAVEESVYNSGNKIMIDLFNREKNTKI